MGAGIDPKGQTKGNPMKSFVVCENNISGSCKTCEAPVKQDFQGNWFITMGHPGFNSPANNRSGYKTKEAAVKAYKRYASK